MENEVVYTGLLRNAKEVFYTKDDVVKMCYTELRKQKIINKGDLLIEPSAGKGAFIKYMRRLTPNIRCYDIEPAHKSIVKQDFLTLQMEYDIDTPLHFIGNPPFGRQSSLARKFIKRCCAMNADSISFILPRSFKKESYQRSFDRMYHLEYEMDIPEKAFTIQGNDYSVPCVFQIWVKKTFNRTLQEPLAPYQFEFVKYDQNPDFTIRRVGVYAGKVDLDCNKSPQSHYFIRLGDGNKLSNIVSELEKVTYSGAANTVGPKSISKQEIIKILNELLNQ